MSRPDVNHCLRYLFGSGLLRYIRDDHLTEPELLEYMGISTAGYYYVLLKARLLILDNGQVLLSPDHCQGDESTFIYQNMRMHIDDDIIDIYRQDDLAI